MRVADLNEHEVEQRLAGAGVALDFGAARARIQADAAGLGRPLYRLYGGFPLEDASGFFDVSVRMRPTGALHGALHGALRPQVRLVVDGMSLSGPFPRETQLALLEWGVSHLMAQRLGFQLLLHAGVVEAQEKAVLLPALPGAGKSTLTAALASRGFRLLSDEIGVVRPSDGRVLPLLRPIALKNESIDVIERFAPRAALGPRCPATGRGTVAHMAPDTEAVSRRHRPAQPALVVFPRYSRGARLHVEPVKPSRAFARLAVNTFNYETLGPVGFEAVARLVETTRTYGLVYGDLEAAVGAIGDLLAAAA